MAYFFVFTFSCCIQENRFFRLPEVRDAHPVLPGRDLSVNAASDIADCF